MGLSFEKVIVNQPLFLTDRRGATSQDKATQINKVFQIAAMIPLLSTLTSLVRIYQIHVVKQMDAKRFKGGDDEKAATIEMLKTKMVAEFFCCGWAAEIGNDIANYGGAIPFGQPISEIELPVTKSSN